MDFNLTEEQIQFAEAIRRWAEKNYSFEERKHIVHSASGVSDKAWQALAELGAIALPIPEAQGGFNGNAIDMMVVLQEIGRGLIIEPYFATVLGAEFLKRTASHNELLETIATGKTKLACALHEQQSRHDLFDIACTAQATSAGFVLNGQKTIVLHGAQADALIVSARTKGAQRDLDGISLFLVQTSSLPVGSVQDYRTVDGMRAANLRFEQLPLPASALIGSLHSAWDILDAVSDYGISLLCAEAIGLMEALFATTLDYLKTRQQFGAPIGKFQALQHRMAEMFMEMEQARSLATLAAVKVDSTDPNERRRCVSAAKARVGQAARFIGQQAVQLHGGMGVTNELPAAHMFKRLTMIELSLGDTDHHLARFAALPNFLPNTQPHYSHA